MKLPDTLTIAQAAAVHGQLQAALASCQDSAAFAVDASGLQDCDTSALAVLLEAHRASRARGLGFVVSQPPAKLAQLAALYGVEHLLGLGASTRPA